MTLGRPLRRPDLPIAGARWCEAALPERSVYRFLARERGGLFPAELFADLFQPTGRRSVPPQLLAVVMVLQRLEGLSDREAADRFAFDARWRYAAGVADAVAGEETASFAATVLVDFRARLHASADPDRIFRVTCGLARQAGLVGVVYGDSAYGTGAHLAWLNEHGLVPMVKAQIPIAPGGRFAKDQFRIDLQAATVTCPARVRVMIRPVHHGRGGGRARFGMVCSVCPLRTSCTTSARGRVVTMHPHEAQLAAARARQRDPAWQADYRATRPKVERKLAHLLRRRHGGRRAPVRGLVRVTQDFKLLAGAVTWPASPPSGSTPPPAAGGCSRPDRRSSSEPHLRDDTRPANTLKPSKNSAHLEDSSVSGCRGDQPP